jgi:hypothetical protein
MFRRVPRHDERRGESVSKKESWSVKMSRVSEWMSERPPDVLNREMMSIENMKSRQVSARLGLEAVAQAAQTSQRPPL